MDWLTVVLSSPVTPMSLAFSCVALVVFGYTKGWIMSKFVVQEMLATKDARIEDYKTALALEKARNDKQFELVNKLLVQSELIIKILKALPLPEEE